jgi:hypothetical protein
MARQNAKSTAADKKEIVGAATRVICVIRG